MGDRGIKQVDLVRAAAGQGVKLGKSHVSQYVSGKTVPRTDILHFLAAALQVDEDWLLNGNIKKPEKINERENKSPGGSIMREFKKSSKLDNVLYDVRGPVVEEANRMESAGTHVLKLNIGNPAPFGFRTPDEVIYDMRQQLTVLAPERKIVPDTREQPVDAPDQLVGTCQQPCLGVVGRVGVIADGYCLEHHEQHHDIDASDKL